MKKEEYVHIDLSKQRNRNSAERTLLAWLRTGLSFIGFGFGIPGVSGFLVLSHPDKAEKMIFDIKIFGISFIVLGLVGIVMAMVQYNKDLKRIQKKEYQYEQTFPLAFFIAGSLALIGLFALLVLIRELL
jgi:putative membrane protein